MLLIGTSVAAAAQLAERLRLDVERQLKSCSSTQPSVTCSFGVADSTFTSKQSLVGQAEMAVARARKLGQNCVSMVRESPVKISVAA
jgi:GGDEF domain-containing protein